jgi:hydroxymethylglutaryl-CoA reductase (NADPH)
MRRPLSAVPDPDEPLRGRPTIDLVPRFAQQGYGRGEVDRRRAWVEERTGARLHHVGSFTLPSEEMRGNVENPVGVAQVPLGVAGPLAIRGEHAKGTVYVPLATTEGALVRSYERGMVALTRAGGATVRVSRDTNRVAPVFSFADVAAAHDFARELPLHLEAVRAQAEGTTRHGRLLGIEPAAVGREVIVTFTFSTGDAHGMNMVVKAADRACRWLAANTEAESYLLFSGAESEKRASGALFAGGKGKRVVAGAEVPRRTVRAVLLTTPEAMVELWRRTVVGHLHAGAFGYNGHVANGLTALFIATGQDVANVTNSAVAITGFEITPGGDLYASVTLPSLTVATVGGGTGLGSARECLGMLGCAGTGGARKLAEIATATVLAGELSMGAAIAAGGFVEAHETYGRNRPKAGPESAGPASPGDPDEPTADWGAA